MAVSLTPTTPQLYRHFDSFLRNGSLPFYNDSLVNYTMCDETFAEVNPNSGFARCTVHAIN